MSKSRRQDIIEAALSEALGFDVRINRHHRANWYVAGSLENVRYFINIDICSLSQGSVEMWCSKAVENFTEMRAAGVTNNYSQYKGFGGAV